MVPVLYRTIPVLVRFLVLVPGTLIVSIGFLHSLTQNRTRILIIVSRAGPYQSVAPCLLACTIADQSYSQHRLASKYFFYNFFKLKRILSSFFHCFGMALQVNPQYRPVANIPHARDARILPFNQTSTPLPLLKSTHFPNKE